MAKTTTAKTTAKTSRAPVKKAAHPKSALDLTKVAESVIQKMEALNLDQKLQSEIQWCLGSYKNDHNPIGLLEKIGEALALFKSELAKKTKGITAKFVGDIEKVLAG